MVAVIPFVACSSDDDNGGQDPIVGKWLLSASVEYKDGEQIQNEQLSECEKESLIEYRVDGGGSSSRSYIEDGECVGDGYGLTWRNIGNGIYAISVNKQAEEEYSVVVHGKTLMISQSYEDAGIEYSYTETFKSID